MAENKKKLSKLTILFTVVIVGTVGLIGVFKGSPVDIDAFAKFATSFASIFIPFALVIAGGGEAKRLINMKYGNGHSTELSPPTEGGK